MNQNRLFVGNLSYQTMENDLRDYFSQAGVVSSVNLMIDKMTGKSRGFAFIEFATPEEANKAVEQFHNKEFQGRTLTVNVARPRERARAALGREKPAAGELARAIRTRICPPGWVQRRRPGGRKSVKGIKSLTPPTGNFSFGLNRFYG